MRTKRRKHSIDVRARNSRSRFKVDLVDMAKEQKEKEVAEAEASIIFRFRTWIENLLGDEEVEKVDDGIKYEEKHLNFSKEFKEKPNFKEAFEHLYFLLLARKLIAIAYQLFSLSKKTCYRVGWTAVFLLKFVYYFFNAIYLKIKKVLKYPLLFLKNSRKESNRIWQKDYNPGREPEMLSLSDYIYKENNPEPLEPIESTEALQKIENKNESPEQLLYTQARLLSPRVLEAPPLPEMSIGETLASLIPRPSLKLIRPAWYFCLALLIFVLPLKAMTYYFNLNDLKGRVLGVSEAALGGIKYAGVAAGSLDFEQAGEHFSEASKNFSEARNEISEISGQLKFLSTVIPSSQLRLAADAEYILAAGEITSQIGEHISYALEPLSGDGEKDLTTVFGAFAEQTDYLRTSTQELFALMAKIDASNLPAEYQDNFKIVQEKSLEIKNSFEELYVLIENIKVFLGYYEDKSYLLVFQNNSEMRASGGFIGSFARVDFSEGRIINISVPPGGSYDTEAGLMTKVKAPEPLRIVNPLWHFWDANWWPDWKKTAKKLIWFYEHSDGPSVDGVISLTPTAVEGLIRIFGGLDMRSGYGVYINSENFWEITQSFSEEKPREHPGFHENPYLPEAGVGEEESENEVVSEIIKEATDGEKPKKIIGDMIEVIAQELPLRLDKEMFFGILKSIEESLRQKHLMFYFNDPGLQRKAEAMDWAGRMKKTDFDYLMVVNTNISGGKSDRDIRQKIFHKAELRPDGTIINTVRVIRIHVGEKGEMFTGVKNLDWMRFYLPLGSEFIEAKGFWPPPEESFEKPDPDWLTDPDIAASEENYTRDSISWTKIYNESGKTVFGNWSQLDPGESIELMIKYKLPWHIGAAISPEAGPSPYALLLEKQPGDVGSEFMSLVSLPDGLNMEWLYPTAGTGQKYSWEIKEYITEDRFWAVLIDDNL